MHFIIVVFSTEKIIIQLRQPVIIKEIITQKYARRMAKRATNASLF